MSFRLLVSWTWFFLVLFSYYVLKPVRDALATETRLFGPLYLATFLAVCAALPLYWRIVGRTTRWQLVFGVYQFFVACLVAFAVLLARGCGDATWLRSAFFRSVLADRGANDAVATRVRRVPVFRRMPGRVCRAASARMWRRDVAAQRILPIGTGGSWGERRGGNSCSACTSFSSHAWSRLPCC